MEKETIDMLEAFGMRDKTTLTSFNYESIKNAKAYRPDYRVGYLYGAEEPDPVGKIRAIGGEELCPFSGILTREMTREYQQMGYSVRAWGVYDQEIMKRMCACGVNGMTVNFPDILDSYLAGERSDKAE